MNLRYLGVLLIGLLLTTSGYGQSASMAQARQIFEDFAERNQIPGTAVAVWKDGEIIWSAGLGYADLEQRVPVDAARTKFRIGSVSKPLTAAALGVLYESGKIDLDAPIQKYVPDFPPKKYPISLRQLAGHTAGIRHYRGDEFLSSRRYDSVVAGLSIFQDDTLLFEPGTKYAYSSYGWNLISAAIEEASGTDFLTYMKTAVFAPLKMTNTTADYTDRLVPFRSRWYQKDDGGVVRPAPYVDNSYKWAGGGFLSTVEDLIRFGAAHLEGDLLQPATVALWTTPQQLTDGTSTGYGIGWRSGTTDAGYQWIGHSGGSVGGVTQFVIYPEERVIVVMLTNLSPVRYDQAHHKIAACFLE